MPLAGHADYFRKYHHQGCRTTPCLNGHLGQEGSHYSVGWLTVTATANSLQSEESTVAADLLRSLRQAPNLHSEDALLMTKPCWWVPGPNDMALCEPQWKRKWESTAPIRGGASSHSAQPYPESMNSTAPSSGFSIGLSASMHTSTSHMDPHPSASARPSYMSGWQATPPEEYFLENNLNLGWSKIPTHTQNNSGAKEGLEECQASCHWYPS